MKRLIILFCFIQFIFCININANTWSVSELEQPRKYDATNFVSNPDKILSTETVTQINALLGDINAKTNAQVAVAVIDNFNGSDIDRFATDLFEEWGVGEKGADNGILIVVARDAHKYSIRTGRGIGSVITDAESGRIGKDIFVPYFVKEDYNNGVLEGVKKIHQITTNPEAIEIIKRDSARAEESTKETIIDLILFYLWCSVAMTIILAILSIYEVKKISSAERHQRYIKLNPFKKILFGMSFVFAGLPFLVYLPLSRFVNNLRNGLHKCPNCGTKMNKIDEIHDNEHLTPAQDAEERFNSVDYDVWECPSCGEEDVYAFINQDSKLSECPNCHARTAYHVRDRVVKQPTATSEGIAVKEFNCLNCKKPSQKGYKLPKQAVAAGSTIPFIIGGMGRGGGFGGGSFGGGFGGGYTGGGGASGSW